MSLLKPVLPRTAERTASFLRCGELAWDGVASPLLDHEIARFEPLLTRVEQGKDRRDGRRFDGAGGG